MIAAETAYAPEAGSLDKGHIEMVVEDNPYPVSVSEHLAPKHSIHEEGGAASAGMMRPELQLEGSRSCVQTEEEDDTGHGSNDSSETQLPMDLGLPSEPSPPPLPPPPPLLASEAEARPPPPPIQEAQECEKTSMEEEQQQEDDRLRHEMQMRAAAAAAAAQSVGISPEMAQALSQSMSGSLGGVPATLDALGTTFGGGALSSNGLDADVLGGSGGSSASDGGAAAAAAAPSTAAALLPVVPAVGEEGSEAEAMPMVTSEAMPMVTSEAMPMATGEAMPMATLPTIEAGEGEMVEGEPTGEQSHTCTVCRKVFKREMNLIFHMTTHRPRQPQADPVEPTSSAPVKCQDCGKVFATKYQAKKHFLRRHFAGTKPFACTKCGKKRFVVKEDMTMHMKSCGNVYVCKCGIRLCSLGALKRHCKYFEHVRLSQLSSTPAPSVRSPAPLSRPPPPPILAPSLGRRPPGPRPLHPPLPMRARAPSTG